MLLHHRGPHGPRDVEVDVLDPDATVADLAAALAPGHPLGPLVIDGVAVPAATPIDRAPLGDGSTVTTAAPDGGSDPRSRPVVVVTTVGGLDAGRAVRLGAGRHRLGRVTGRDGDPHPEVPVEDATVSRRHAVLVVDESGDVVVEDLGSTNGSWLGDQLVTTPTPWPPDTLLRCGATTFDRGAPDPGEVVPTRTGSPPWPWHRPPVDAAAPEAEPPLEPPAEPDPPPTVSPVGIVAVLGSLAVGAVMVVVLGSWMYALFALLGPVMMIAGAVDGRIRRRRSRRRGGRRRRADLAALDRSLTERRTAHLAHLDTWHPGPAAAVERSGSISPSRAPSPLLWARRSTSPGARVVRLGTGTAPWSPPVAGDPRHWAADVREVVDRHRTSPGSAIVAALEPGRPLVLVGPADVGRAVARSVLGQLATDLGPGDLRIAALVDPASTTNWTWLRWLPHTRDATVGPLLVATGASDASAHVVAGLADVRAPHTVVLVEDPHGLRGARGPARAVLRAATGPDATAAAIVLVADRRDAPADGRIVEVGADGVLTGPTDLVAGPAAAVGLGLRAATGLARSLARFDDPEVDDPGRGLPATVPLRSLLGADALTPAGIVARWSVQGVDPAPRATIGRAADGPLEIDLVADGPHALVAGTTGAGKSELLRTLVVGLAVGAGPDHLTFVLVDFKGGAAFDACARLPHTVGLVTDLDEHLAARALRCLEAELRHRERRLQAAGASDLAAFRAAAGIDHEPLPRLVVVIDEFATLAAELPAFVDALVGIAQRGRSLGVHLVLATQRPAGAVNDHIRANTALRIALRVQDAADSLDVVGVPGAADLPRDRPGRAVVRLGPTDVVTAQTAWTGDRSAGSAAEGVRVRPLAFDDRATNRDRAGSNASVGPDDLRRTVDAVDAAWTLADGRPPRRPWPDPLPAVVDLRAGDGPTRSTGRGLVLGRADTPDDQCQVPFRWLLDDGPLLLVGRPGSGCSTGLATTVLAAADRWDAAALHVHVVDLGAGALLPLAGLPQVGAVIGADEPERQRRLVEDLAEDLSARRAEPGRARPRRLVVVDGIGPFHDRWDELDPSGTWPRLVELAVRGSEIGLHLALAADGASRIPQQILSACTARVVLRLADDADAAVLGVGSLQVGDRAAPGRGVATDGPTEVQLGRYAPDLGDAVARVAGRGRPVALGEGPRPVRTLPDRVRRSALGGPASTVEADGGVVLVVGVSDVGLRPARLVLPPGGHALVAGPPRSGRTTALRTVAEAAVAAGATVVGIAPGGWAQAGVVGLAADDPALADALAVDGPLVVVVDDADLLDEHHPVLGAVVRARRPGRHVVATARPDRARTAYAHWLRELRADRSGVLLRPDPDVDGELLGARLPRRSPVPDAAGRGWLVGAPVGFVQLARPDDS